MRFYVVIINKINANHHAAPGTASHPSNQELLVYSHTQTDTMSETITPSLPLGWTRVQRRRKRKDRGVVDYNAVNEDCCIDPRSSCPRRRLLTTSSRASTILPPTGEVIDGHVVFCLHELDPSWFQGYFIPKNGPSRKPWGLLAVQESVDDCLACVDGGYRRISLSIYHRRLRTPSENSKNNNSNVVRIPNIDWTGGDILRLSHPEGRVAMETDRFVTGNSCLPYIEKYFENLIVKLKEYCDSDDEEETNKQSNNNTSNVLEWLPNIAIVTGSMSIALLKE